MNVRTRMAPSPTGEYHVGHIATLLKNYAFARRHGGQFVLRIEDTDQERKVEGAVERIMQVIKNYGLNWDEGPDVGGPYTPYTQSERLPTYKKYAEQLVQDGKAYYCFCSKDRLEKVRADQIASKQQPRYDGHCRQMTEAEIEERLDAGEPAVIRLKVPQHQQIHFTDLVRGPISVESDSIDDQVLLKSDGFPTYHLAVVVDDHLMGITHIMRGEEWISSTPKHILLYEAFGWEKPVFAHIPVFLNPDGKGKMSKRKGTVAAQSFLDQGYLPDAMLNFFMILGWAAKDQREILSLEEYIAEFDPADISSKSVVFDLKKLAWLNGIYIRRLSDDDLWQKLQPFIPAGRDLSMMRQLLPLLKERLVTLADIGPLSDYFFDEITLNTSELLNRADSADLVAKQLDMTLTLLGRTDWQTEALETALRSLQTEQGWNAKQYFMMLRHALTAQPATPPLFDMMVVLGIDTSTARLQTARNLL